jgi:hypothetical protein
VSCSGFGLFGEGSSTGQPYYNVIRNETLKEMFFWTDTCEEREIWEVTMIE